MGVKPKSTAELERSGAFRKNPARGRERAGEPTPTAKLGDPPEDFLSKHGDGPKLLAAWNELLKETEGFLITIAHRGLFEMTCRLTVRCRRPGARTGDFAQHIAHRDRLGLGGDGTRSKVLGNAVKTTEQEEDEWEDAAAGSTGLGVHVQ